MSLSVELCSSELIRDRILSGIHRAFRFPKVEGVWDCTASMVSKEKRPKANAHRSQLVFMKVSPTQGVLYVRRRRTCLFRCNRFCVESRQLPEVHLVTDRDVELVKVNQRRLTFIPHDLTNLRRWTLVYFDL